MKRIKAGIFVLFLLTIASRTIASDRVIVYPLQNPSSTQQQLIQRYPRLSIGTFLRDALGYQFTGGTYDNLQISPGTGLYVTVAPAVANSIGTVYQLGPDDVNPIPVNTSPQLPADSTQIMIQGVFSANTTSLPIGPLTAPTVSGQSVYYLIEAQLTQIDKNPQSELFINQANAKYYQTVNTTRTDAIIFQIKAGTPSSSPVVPTVDSGWVNIGTVSVSYGQTSIASGQISMSAPFLGFSAPGVSGVTSIAVTSPLQTTGGLAPTLSINSSPTFSGTVTGGNLSTGGTLTAGTITDSGITGSTQCVQVNSSGVLSGAGTLCGSSTSYNSANGYFTLSTGAVHEWGSVGSIPADGSNPSGTAISFPYAFPNALYSFVATPTQNGSSFTDALSIQTKISGTSVWVYVTGGAPGTTCTVYYQADGH